MYPALYPVLTMLDTESCVPPISADDSQNKKKVGILADTVTENTSKGEDILQFSCKKDLAVEWK